MSWYAVYGFLKDWQTLIGSLLALGAAIGTIRMMSRSAEDDARRHQDQIDELRRQTDFEDTRHKELLERKALAARAHMPDAISEICGYLRSVVAFLTSQSEAPPEEPIVALATLKQAIEHIDTDAALRTFEMVSWYQVQKVRREDISMPLCNPYFSERLYDAVLLFAYANSLFDYARNEEQTVSTDRPTRREMDTAFKNAIDFRFRVANEERFRPLYGHFERRHENEADHVEN